MSYIVHGRCKSGKRWFWIAAELDYADHHKCADPVCVYGGPHAYGWEDTEDAALKAMSDAVTSFGGEAFNSRAGVAADALKRINAAKRRARPAKPDASGTAPVEYLYEPWSWSDDYGETHKGINEIPIVKKTAKRIYYDKSDSRDLSEGVVTLGFISREEFETDTRCRDLCPRDIPAGLVCAPHSRGFPHCVHFGDWRTQGRRCWMPPGCENTCPIDTPGTRCAKHGSPWEHCPHDYSPGQCIYGSAAGECRLPAGSGHYDGGTVYATREAAEENLYRWEREQQRKRPQEPELKRLRHEMADAHPDRGGTNEQFIAARKRYEHALRAMAS